jgi:aldehyde:ferredoxin oxidoreductase
LWIKDDKVEIRDASHLRGKGTLETAEIIKEELNEPEAKVATIGMAGENRGYFATIQQENASVSRGGIGGVMGDKGLKAIAVRGTKDINIARPAEFMAQYPRLYMPLWAYKRWQYLMKNGTSACSPGDMLGIGERIFTPKKSMKSGRKLKQNGWSA